MLDFLKHVKKTHLFHEISQERILQQVAIFFFRGSSRLRDRTSVSCLAGRFYTTQTPGKPVILLRVKSILREGSAEIFLLPNLPEAGGMRGWVLEGVCSDTSSLLLLLGFLPSFDMLAHSSFWNTLLLASVLPHSCFFFFFPFLSEGLPFRPKFHGDFPGPLFLFTQHECILSHAFKYYLMTFKFIIVTHMS